MLKNENHRPVQAEETKKRILQAAAEVFAEKSFHSATISEITNRGVWPRVLYIGISQEKKSFLSA